MMTRSTKVRAPKRAALRRKSPATRQSSKFSRRKDIDPITFSVILNRFNTIANEMTLVMERTAWTSIIALSHDFSCAIYDRQNRQVCMMDALPIHTNSMHVVLKEIARVFDGNIHEGDVIVCNDPYSGNTHVGDFVTACPVFYKGEHLFWSVTKGHQLDCGAFMPTSVPAAAKDVFQEGLQLPPIKFYEKGKPVEDVIRMYLANVRWKEWLYGDLMAQLGSIWTGQKRILALLEQHGKDQLERYIDAIFDYSDDRMAAEIIAMPNGEYHGDAWLDSDGQGGTNILIHAKVTIDGDQAHVDFAGSSPQGPGSNNSTQGVMQAAAGIPIMSMIDPTIPHNDGCLRHITAEAPSGTVCNAEYPTSTALATICPGDTMQIAVWKALSRGMPERATGGHPAIHCVPMFSGTDARSDEPKEWGSMVFNASPGAGAGVGCDGWPIFLSPAAMGGQKIISVEVSEMLYPMHFDKTEIEVDSMGLGEDIGGPGVVMQIRPTSGAMECNIFGDGQMNPPYGTLGGTPGVGGGCYKENLTTGERTYYSAKGNLAVEDDEIWVGVSTGGGGRGDPLKRDPEAVLESVFDGMVSLKNAKAVHGVAINRATMTIDFAETERLRKKMQKARGPLEVAVPDRPGAGDWTEQRLRRGEEYLIDSQ
jgi:N-methylhydantoinase B